MYTYVIVSRAFSCNYAQRHYTRIRTSIPWWRNPEYIIRCFRFQIYWTSIVFWISSRPIDVRSITILLWLSIKTVIVLELIITHNSGWERLRCGLFDDGIVSCIWSAWFVTYVSIWFLLTRYVSQTQMIGWRIFWILFKVIGKFPGPRFHWS